MMRSFKKWIISEYANYGFDDKSKIRGGSEIPKDPGPIKPIDPDVFITELKRLPLNGNQAYTTLNDQIAWGEGVGSIQLELSPLGSTKIITRRQSSDLKGETTWICKHIFPVHDQSDTENEIGIAHKIHEELEKINMQMLEGPSRTCENFERMAWKLWSEARANFPSYIMFPTEFRRMDKEYFKLVFEFRGQGVETLRSSGRAEQFNIDFYFDKEKGFLRCWGYNIESSLKQHSWQVQPSEWDEYFSPNQPIEEITKAVISAFSKY
jgi:hypothetical protein